MIIRIESIENGWATERHIELEDDPKLLKALLGAVKRHAGTAEAQLHPPVEAGASPAEGGGDAGWEPARCAVEDGGVPLIRRGEAAPPSPAGEG